MWLKTEFQLLNTTTNNDKKYVIFHPLIDGALMVYCNTNLAKTDCYDLTVRKFSLTARNVTGDLAD